MAMTYQEWKRMRKCTLTPDILAVHNFEKQNPAKAAEYKKRLATEQEKRSEIANIKDRAARLRAIQNNMELFQ